MKLMELNEKIAILKNTMGLVASRICEQNPEYRELKGRLNAFLEIQQEQQTIINNKKEVTE